MGQDEEELLDFLDFVEKELASAKARDKYEKEHVEKLEEIKMKIKQKMENMKNKSDNSQYSYRPSPEQQKREREEQEQWREAVRQRARQEEERRRAQMEELKKAREAREKEEEAARQRQQAEQDEQQRKQQEEQDRNARYQEETPNKYNWKDPNNTPVEMAYFSKYERFFKLLDIKIEYTIMSKVTYRPIQVTYPIYTNEFYKFIEEHRKEIITKSRKFMLKHKDAVLGNVNPNSKEAQDVRLVNDVKDHIFRKLFISANIAYILKLLHKRLQALEARAGSDLPPRRCSRIAG